MPVIPYIDTLIEEKPTFVDNTLHYSDNGRKLCKYQKFYRFFG
jgi:hypothetical protein